MKLGTLFFDRPGSRSPGWVLTAWIFLLVSLCCAGVMSWAATQGGWMSVWKYRDVFWKGWLLTILISLVSLSLSTLIGLMTALASRSAIIPLKGFARIYVEVVRGTPLLVQILFLFYVVAGGLGIESRLAAGTIILSLFSGAYLAEIIRAGVESIPASQIESARAIGFTNLQIDRLVILPQALRQILPALTGQFASLIKDSSLLSIIGLGEFTLAAQQVNSATYRTLESYLPLALGYLVLTLPISVFARSLESRLRYEA